MAPQTIGVSYVQERAEIRHCGGAKVQFLPRLEILLKVSPATSSTIPDKAFEENRKYA
jgi:hypothetical protein